MDSEADRLAIIESLGGCARAVTSSGHTGCIFENGSIGQPTGTGLEIADRTPQITVTTLEAKRLGLDVRGALVRIEQPCVEPVDYSVRAPAADGTGMTVIELEATT